MNQPAKQKESRPNSAVGASRFIDKKDVLNLCGFRNTMLYQLMREGDFPKQIKIGVLSRWDEHQVLAWMDAQRSKAAAQ